MKTFAFDTILDRENICNLTKEQRILCKGVESGKHFVVYGRRNTGKTSIIKSVVIPHFKNKHKKSFVLFADLLSVRNVEELTHRVQMAFQNSFSESFPVKSVFLTMIQFISDLKPAFTIDPTTSLPTLSLEVKASVKSIRDLFHGLKKISEKVSVLIVFDEFQDIHQIPEAEGLLRDCLQNLSPKIPIILLGSKKHLLSTIFAKQRAPFFNWGEDMEFSKIPYDEYTDYMNERFKAHRLLISPKTSQILQDHLDRIPEPINIVCAALIEQLANRHSKTYEITDKDVIFAISDVVQKRSSRFQQYLTTFTSKEEQVLIALAKYGPISQPMGKDFVAKTAISTKGLSLIIKKLENDAIIYREQLGYQLADPLLRNFLIMHR